MHKVAVLALDSVVGFDLSIPCQVFNATRLATGERPYEVRVCGPARGVVARASGVDIFRIEPPFPLAAAADCDTILVPGVSVDEEFSAEALDILRTVRRRGTRIAAICTGAFVLAAAGLLDGRRVTTHWAFAAALGRRHPLVEVDSAVLYVDEGDVLTSAGVAAGLDLCLHIVRTDHGAAVAANTARSVVMPPQRDGGQAQFIVHQDPAADTGTLVPTMCWMRENLDRILTLDDIARHAGTSVRTLNRRFKDQIGATPLQWLIGQRLSRARELLETTSLSIEQVAQHAGFGSAVGLRQHFVRTLGTAPVAYRRAFQETAL
ncbi:GlxA family transcriptional regulator [Fodinicola feengrottensis]|uniref:GlxA family transcriptional regulator n=1 Tax=Fodinicola feengrottensis TaxID=435914 RepID=UPI0013D7A57C|nr:helix-turn-helix domain-containing protein [Fodinicola feengrottensis]